MPAILMFLAAVVAAGGDQSAAQPAATQTAALETPEKTRDRATNEALLAALLEKRSEIARSWPSEDAGRNAEARRYALEFLDRQIAKIKKEMEQ